MEIHTILVPTDFSTYAAHALQEACAIAARHTAQVLLLHVLPPLAFWGEDWAQRAAFEAQIQAGAEQQLVARTTPTRLTARGRRRGAAPLMAIPTRA